MAERSKYFENSKKNIIIQKEVSDPYIAGYEEESVDILHEYNSESRRPSSYFQDLQVTNESPIDGLRNSNENRPEHLQNTGLQQQCIEQEKTTLEPQLDKIDSTDSSYSDSTSSSSSSPSSVFSSDDSVADPNFNVNNKINLSSTTSGSESPQAYFKSNS